MPSDVVVLATASLPSRPTSVGLARGRLREWCRAWGLRAEVVGDAALATSELVTNALAHGDAPVWLSAAVVDAGAALVIDVYDGAPVTERLLDAIASAAGTAEATDTTRASPQTATDGATSDVSSTDAAPELPGLLTGGRGLHLTAVLAERVLLLPHPRIGKTVRVHFASG